MLHNSQNALLRGRLQPAWANVPAAPCFGHSVGTRCEILRRDPKYGAMLRRLVRWLQPVFLLLAVIAITWFLAGQWPTLRSYPWRLHWGWLLLTGIINLASWGLEIAIWRYLLSALGGNIPYMAAARIWFLSAVMRYVPGTIWQPLSITVYNRRYGVSPEASITSLVFFQVVMILAIIPILVVYFAWLDTKSLAADIINAIPTVLLWLALVPLIAFLLRPQWLVQLLNWVLARLQRPPLAMHLSSRKLLALILVSLFDWLLWGGVFAAFTFAVAGEGLVSNGSSQLTLAPLLVASYSIANVIGLMTMISPSGFGVREGAFYLLLTPHIAGSVVTVLALGMRVWSVVAELLLALVSAPFERAAANGNAPSPAHRGQATIDLPTDFAVPEPVVAPDITRTQPHQARPGEAP